MSVEALAIKYPGQLSEGFRLECGSGWLHLVDAALHMIRDRSVSLGVPPPMLRKASEKLGTLRLSCSQDDPKIEAYVEMVWSLSARTCEICGCPGGSVFDGGWQRTRCIEHRDTPVQMGFDQNRSELRANTVSAGPA